MPLTQKQIDGANELFNRGLNVDGQPLSPQQKQIISTLRQRGSDPASTLLRDGNIPSANTETLNREIEAHKKAEPTPLLDRIANSPIVNFLTAADIGTQKSIANVVRSIYRDIPTETTRNWAKSIGEKIKSEKRTFVTPGAVADVGELVGGITPFLAAAPLAPEALVGKGIAPLLGRLGVGAVAGATQAPRHQALGALLGAGGAGLGETLPAVAKLGGKGLQKFTTAALGPSVRNEMSNIMKGLRKEITGDNMNDEVFRRMSKLYEETKGSALTPQGEEVLADADFIHRNPADSVHNLYATAARLGDENIESYDPSEWKKGLETEISKNQADLERSPKNKNAKEVLEELDAFANTRLKNFDDAKLLREDVNEAASRGALGGNTKLMRLGRPLKAAVDKSLLESAANDPQTLSALTKANTTFKNELLPFESIGKEESPFIKRYRGKKLGDKLIEDYVKPKQPKRLDLFLKQLPDQEARDLVAVHKFAPFENNPKGFMTQYEKMQEEEKNLLFPNHKSRLDQMQSVFRANKEAFPTQATGDGALSKLIKGGVGLGIGSFALERLAQGSPIEAAALLTPLALKTGISGAARIPAVREHLFQSLIKQQAEQPANISILRSILPGAAAPQVAQKILGGQQNG